MREPGLQSERTALAWRRTALGVLANALRLIRAGLLGDHTLPLASGPLLLGAAGATQCLSAWRRRELSLAEGAAALLVSVLDMARGEQAARTQQH